MEGVCNRMLELDQGRAVLHSFGGAGAWDKFKEVGEE
jgi:hypothetical protein